MLRSGSIVDTDGQSAAEDCGVVVAQELSGSARSRVPAFTVTAEAGRRRRGADRYCEFKVLRTVRKTCAEMVPSQVCNARGDDDSSGQARRHWRIGSEAGNVCH